MAVLGGESDVGESWAAGALAFILNIQEGRGTNTRAATVASSPTGKGERAEAVGERPLT
jgi:hypothetical protein